MTPLVMTVAIGAHGNSLFEAKMEGNLPGIRQRLGLEYDLHPPRSSELILRFRIYFTDIAEYQSEGRRSFYMGDVDQPTGGGIDDHCGGGRIFHDVAQLHDVGYIRVGDGYT